MTERLNDTAPNGTITTTDLSTFMETKGYYWSNEAQVYYHKSYRLPLYERDQAEYAYRLEAKEEKKMWMVWTNNFGIEAVGDEEQCQKIYEEKKEEYSKLNLPWIAESYIEDLGAEKFEFINATIQTAEELGNGGLPDEKMSGL